MRSAGAAGAAGAACDWILQEGYKTINSTGQNHRWFEIVVRFVIADWLLLDGRYLGTYSLWEWLLEVNFLVFNDLDSRCKQWMIPVSTGLWLQARVSLAVLDYCVSIWAELKLYSHCLLHLEVWHQKTVRSAVSGLKWSHTRVLYVYNAKYCKRKIKSNSCEGVSNTKAKKV